jgi:hypothetical protein
VDSRRVQTLRSGSLSVAVLACLAIATDLLLPALIGRPPASPMIASPICSQTLGLPGRLSNDRFRRPTDASIGLYTGLLRGWAASRVRSPTASPRAGAR